MTMKMALEGHGVFARQEALTQLLAKEGVYHPARYYAHLFDCSIKTIRNDLKTLTTWGLLLEYKAGQGIRALNAAEFLQNMHKKKSYQTMTPEERRQKILFRLLAGTEETLSLQKLAEEFYVSRSSIVNDLAQLEKRLTGYHVHLQKDVHGTRAVGLEKDMRQALATLISTEGTFAALESNFGKEAVNFIEDKVRGVETSLGFEIAEQYRMNLITYITIQILRVKNHNLIAQNAFATEEEPIRQNIFNAAGDVVRSIEKKFHQKFSKEEAHQIYLYLLASGGSLAGHSGKSREITMGILLTCQNVLASNLSSDAFEAFSWHLRSMLFRIRYGVTAKMPILDDVRQKCSLAMRLLRIIMIRVRMQENLPVISEDEIGFLAIYLQNVLESEPLQKERMLLVCTNGAGVSHLLKKRMRKFLPTVEVVGCISEKNVLQHLQQEPVRLIASTVRLHHKVPVPVVHVNPLMDESDAERIRAVLHRPKDIGKEIEVVAKPPVDAPEDLFQCETFPEGVTLFVYRGGRFSEKKLVRVQNDLYLLLPPKVTMDDEDIRRIYLYILGKHKEE